MAGSERQNAHFAPVLPHQTGLGHRLDLIVAALDMEVGADRLEEAERQIVVEDLSLIHISEPTRPY